MKSKRQEIQFIHSIYFKMVLLLLAILCLFLLTVAILYHATKKAMEEDFLTNAHVVTSQIADNIASTMRSLERKNFSAYSVMSTFGDLLNEIDLSEKGSEVTKRNYVKMTNSMDNSQSLMSNVHWLAIADFEHTIYLNAMARRAGITSIDVTRWVHNNLENLIHKYGNVVWAKGPDNSLLFMRAIFNQQSLRFCGFLIACVDKSILDPVFHDIQVLYTGSFLIYDQNNLLLYATGNSQHHDFEPYFSTGQKMDYFVETYPVSYTGLQLVHHIDLSMQNLRYRKILNFSGIIALVMSFLAAMFVLSAFSNLAKSSNRVLLHMDRVSRGDFTKENASNLSWEMQVISNGLDTMAERIQVLLVKVGKAEAAKQQTNYQLLQAKYHALQSQVNPHFLYNVLESINGIAQINGDDQVSEMICNLASFFRGNLFRTDMFCTLQNELDFISKYLNLYQSIYSNGLKIIFEIQPESQTICIPTFLLQPIVENSVVHGMENKMGICTIRIQTFLDSEYLFINVEDDGVGMTKERLLKIKDFTYVPKSNRFGLINVQQRLQLVYGVESGMSIDSEIGCFTRVKLWIPLSYIDPGKEKLKDAE